MEKSLLVKIAKDVTSCEELQKRENEITQAVKTTVENQLMPLGGDIQSLINKVVNAFAVSLNEEIGIRNDESMKMLERIRLNSEKTIKKRKHD
jgi:hypothetical protein